MIADSEWCAANHCGYATSHSLLSCASRISDEDIAKKEKQRSLRGLPMNTLTRARIVITAGVLSVAALLGAVAASVAAAPAVHHTHAVAGSGPTWKP
jgi:hypothetical protein